MLHYSQKNSNQSLFITSNVYDLKLYAEYSTFHSKDIPDKWLSLLWLWTCHAGSFYSYLIVLTQSSFLVFPWHESIMIILTFYSNPSLLIFTLTQILHTLAPKTFWLDIFRSKKYISPVLNNVEKRMISQKSKLKNAITSCLTRQMFFLN